MTQNREKLVEQRAYDVWESDGRPPGQDKEHWSRAKRKLRRKSAPTPTGLGV